MPEPIKVLTPAEIQRRHAVLAASPSIAKAAAALGMGTTTLRHFIKRHGAGPKSIPMELPVFPDEGMEAEQILDHLEKKFSKAWDLHQAKHWFPIKVREKRPVAITWFGDPHLGSDGCNVALLRRDVKIVGQTEGMYGANLGDTTDNWGGRLTRLYAENDMSRPTERKLATWFLDSVPWVLWLEGNHDHMDGAFTAHMRAINANHVPMIDWRARFRLVFPNGREVRIDAAHDHKGHSLWNELHGQDRASLIDEHADLFMAGHRHDWAIKQKELPTGRVATLARARGYKFVDDFATKHGFHQKHNGASIVTVIDPEPRSACELVRAFADVEEGADYLAFKRRKA